MSMGLWYIDERLLIKKAKGMEKFKQWLTLREAEVEDDADDSGVGPLARFAKKPFMQHVLSNQPALAATAAANLGGGVNQALNKSIYGQGEQQYGGHSITDRKSVV